MKEHSGRVLSGMTILLCLWVAAEAARAAEDEPPFVLRAETAMEKFFPNSAKDAWLKADLGDSIAISGCRGESESFQIVVIPLKSLKNLRWQVESASIDAKNIRVCPVGFVDVPKNTIPRWVKHPEDEVFTGPWPDPILGVDSIPELPAERVRSLWVTVDIPESAKAGPHGFSVLVWADGTGKEKVDVKLRVWDFALPARMTLKTSFWYSSSDIQAYYLCSTPEERWEIEKRFIIAALDRRITPINLEILGGLVGLTFEPATGKWTFDFDNFRRYVRVLQTHRRKGNLVNIASHGFALGLGSWAVKIKEGDTVRRSKKRITLKAGTGEYEDFINQYLAAAGGFIRELGVADQAYMGFIDEPGPNVWEAVKWTYPIVKKVLPNVPTAAAVNYMPSAEALKKEIEIMVPGFFTAFNANTLPQWRSLQCEKKRPMWGYVCGKTSDIDYQGVHHRAWPWICWKYDLRGFLYWGIVNWDSDMWRPENAEIKKQLIRKDPKERWPLKAEWRTVLSSGDGYLLYPSPDGHPWSSVRLENIRDGIEDYEYFTILKRLADALAAKQPAGETSALVAQARKLLDVGGSLIKFPEEYAVEPRAYLERREQIGKLIEKMNRELGGAKR